MNTDMTERYILATIAGLPADIQDDLRAELTASIMDATDARIEQGEDPDAAERSVLTELGDPTLLAAGYADRPLHLIGPRYYLTWRHLLRLLLWIVPACAVVGVAIGQALVHASIGTLIGQSIAVGISAAVHVAFWLTVVFAILERTGAETGTPWHLDQLPEPRTSSSARSDGIAWLVFAGIGIGAILWDQLHGAARIDGEALSALDPGLWPGWMLALFVLIALEVLLAVGLVLRRRWSARVALAKTVLAVLWASWALSLIGRDQLVNPTFVDVALRANGVEADTLRVLAVILAVSILGGSIWTSIDGWLKARRDARL